ncbi:Cutinase palindrome-binding protein [Fusarium oxysporum f. sp. albedinis]|nr:Cutinase palindrome-binding protein [Fusarium oxysporum f. sp. albedinis]KAK2470000.1 hypothetical protein H9L39_18377 [Fusarium oxysporum f. sp. albedinis]
MSVNLTFGVSSTTSDTRDPSSGSSLLRPHRCDNCMAPPLPDHPPYCGSSCFEKYLMNLSSVYGSPTGQQNSHLPQDSVRYDTTVAGSEFECSTCAKHTEALGFAASLGTSTNTASFEGTSQPTSVLQPLTCSSPKYNPAKWAVCLYSNGPGSPAVDNLFDDASLLLEEPEMNERKDLHEFSYGESTALLEYEDFTLYKEPDWLDDFEPQLSERAFATPQPKDDNDTMSDDDDICYCGYCWPFSVQDGAGQLGNLCDGEVEGNDVASAA